MSGEYKIGEVASLLDTTVRTIRFYEEEGLLQPLRTDGGTRRYTQRHVSRLRAILALVGNGFSLESIRLIASLREGSATGDESSHKVMTQLDAEIRGLSDKIASLEHLKKTLAKAKRVVGNCQGCHNKPTSAGCPKCPVKQSLGSIELLNLIWDQEE
jgi:MerR family Zn(II)-responsive transcriptional regulator of zntA